MSMTIRVKRLQTDIFQRIIHVDHIVVAGVGVSWHEPLIAVEVEVEA